MPDYLLYEATLSLLTPLHIGSGRTLLHEYDYAIYGRRTWRINERTLLEAQDVDDPALARQLARSKPAELLKPSDFQLESDLFRYVIKGQPRSRAEGAQLGEQLKDSFDRPYLPGSSLKGALRTALAWFAWGERRLRPDPGRLNRNRKWAGQRYEQELFGRGPNSDWLRALQIGDSRPLSAERLVLANARVHHRNGHLASPIELEAIQGDSVFHCPIKLDLALFSKWARRAGLQLDGEKWLRALPSSVQAHTQDRLQREAAWFDQAKNARGIHQFYRQLAGFSPGDNQCLLQVGWGTGWDDKTYGSRLQQDGRFMQEIIGKYSLDRGRREANDPFPKSRRLVVRTVKNKQGQIMEQPLSPFGWCLLEVKERKG